MPSPYAEIDSYIDREMRRLKIPGLALAIVEDDRIVYQRGFGRARPDGETPSPHTPFVLGSTTKSFTALAIMQLAEAGRVELDVPVARYLPWFGVADEANDRITVRHLLNQTSGLPGDPGLTLLGDLDDRPGATERQLRRILPTVRLLHPAGAAFEYSNLNYDLLGLVIEAASGESYEEYLQAHILDPLEMRHTYTSPAQAKQNGLAVGHRYWFAWPVPAPNLPIPRGSLPSGQLISCAEDMGRYLIAQLNGGRYGDAQILSPEGIAEMHRGAVEQVVMNVPLGQYGMGWFVGRTGETETIWHSGNVPDFSSFMAILPEQRKGIVLLLNADHFGFPPVIAEFGLDATALLAGRQPEPFPFPFFRLIPHFMRSMLLLPLFQLFGVFSTLRLIGRWRRHPERRPGRERAWIVNVLLPLLPNSALAAVPLFLRRGAGLKYVRTFQPDAYWVGVLCGGFAAIWSIVRTALVLRALGRKN